jgi:hypothetical protein
MLDVPPMEFVPPVLIEFIEFALLAPLVLYALVELFDVLVHEIRNALHTVSNPKAMILFILDRSPQRLVFG